MTKFSDALLTHLRTGLTHICTCWAVTREDGTVMGFTDHDHPLYFDDITFRADTGLTAVALAQSTGLSVDNTEAIGALSDAAITEADIEAGRFDGAEIRTWQVNWRDVNERQLLFRGHFGELRRKGPAFEAEIRGLAEFLNRPIGRVYQKPCAAVLGDQACSFDLAKPGFRHVLTPLNIVNGRVFRFEQLDGFAESWFQRGRLDVLNGKAEGLWSMIKSDRLEEKYRIIELFEPIRCEISLDDAIQLTAGCDRRFETCQTKFNNIINFQGFPDILPEDWQMLYPQKAGRLDGGSRR